MGKNAPEVFERSCPYEEKHRRCEVKECEECAVLTAFCRNTEKERVERSKIFGVRLEVSTDSDDVQVLRNE